MKQKIKVIQDKDKPVDKPVLAQAIVDISSAARKLTISGLNRKAVIILLSHSTKCSQSVVKDVLDAMEQLIKDYTR